MAEVVMSDAVKHFGKQLVVDGVSFTAAEGSFLALLGPSGCGKTTTLRLVAGLEELGAGELRFDGLRMNEVAPGKRNVGMVFQNYALYPHMTVEQNLAFGLRHRGEAKSEVRRRVAEMAELLGIARHLGRRPKELSGGERQRVALGRALVRRPAVFLMDEPLSNLDASLRERMRRELNQLHQRLPVTTVYVTHDQTEAMTLADQVAVMREGRIVQAGSPAEIYSNPVDTFVAGFVGTPGMNLITGGWSEDLRGLRLGTTVNLPADLRKRLGASGPEVTIGIRPEQLSLGEAGSGEVELRCTVEGIEELGSHSHIFASVNLAGTQGLVARLGCRSGLKVGDQAVLTAPVTAVHVFEAATGRAVSNRVDSAPPPALASLNGSGPAGPKDRMGAAGTGLA